MPEVEDVIDERQYPWEGEGEEVEDITDSLIAAATSQPQGSMMATMAMYAVPFFVAALGFFTGSGQTL